MARGLNEKPTGERERALQVVYRVLRVAVLLILVGVIALRIKEGQYIAIPLGVWVFIALVGVLNIVLIRGRFKGSEDGRKEFRKIVLRSVLLTIVITVVYITGVVWYAVNNSM